MSDQDKKLPGANVPAQAPPGQQNPAQNPVSTQPAPPGSQIPPPPPPISPARQPGVTKGDFFPPPPPPPIESAPIGEIPPEPFMPEQQGIALEPEIGAPPEIIPQGGGDFNMDPAPSYPTPPSLTPEPPPPDVSRIPVELEPVHEGTEIIHERKAESRHYSSTDMDDERAVRAATLKEFRGIREELQKLNELIGMLVKKQG